MPTLNNAPMLRQSDQGPAVADVQDLLNAANTAGLAGQLEVDGKFGPLTAGRVRAFQKSAGLLVDGIVGPRTRAELFAPQADQIDQAQGIASNWTLLAKSAIWQLRGYVRTLQFDGPLPGGNIAVLVEALRVHFKIDLPRPRPDGRGTVGGSLNPLDLLKADDQLAFMHGVYDDVGFVLSQASVRDGRAFYSIGPRECEVVRLGKVSAGVRNVPGSSVGKSMLVCFPPSFAVTTSPDNFRTVHQRASTVLHECCHYVRPPASGPARVEDFAYGLPAFAGQPARNSTHNYQQLTSDEAVRNAESYNLFAEHITFGHDTRFGRLSDDLATFQCGQCTTS